MSACKTQSECRKEFVTALQVFINSVNAIDAVTPAAPTQEPKWWCDMMVLYREAQELEQKYNKGTGL